MKSILGIGVIVFMMTSCTSSYVESSYPNRYGKPRQSFYYYPSANVYYDGSCSRYIYQNGHSWIYGTGLPSGMYLGNQPRVQVYYNGPEVWRENDIHRNKYYTPPPVVYQRRDDDRRYGRHERMRNRNDDRREERDRD